MKKSSTHRLNAGALFYALTVSVIIGMITAGAIAASYYHRLVLHADSVQLELARNAESAVIYACATMAKDELQMDLFGREKDSVQLTRKAWGVYDVIASRAYTGKQSCVRYALVGAVPREDGFALWLSDLDRPLKVTGHTRLKGKCALPRQGVERAYIEGRSFTGTDLVEGTKTSSDRFLPAADAQRSDGLLAIGITTETDTVVPWDEFPVDEQYTRSFADSRLVLKSDGAILLSDVTLSGQILIVSKRKITVAASARLEQLILCAPEIEFRKDAEVSVQAIASDSIVVGEDAGLLYPSALVLTNDRTANDSIGIRIVQGASISGDVLVTLKQSNPHTVGRLTIATKALIAGCVYSVLPVDLQGSVYGSVTCQKFVLRTNSAVYENCLMDAAIDRSAISSAYLGSFMFNSTAADVIQWLD
jgi:hypothetical protein